MLAALGADVRSGLGVGNTSSTPVLAGSSGLDLATEEDGSLAGGALESQLIEGDAFTAGLEDAGTGGRSETESADLELGGGEHAAIVSDGTDQDNGLVFLALDVSGNAGDGHGGAVDSGHKQSGQDDFVELGVSTTSQESVQLDEQANVHILGLRCVTTCGLLDTPTSD